MLRSSPGFHDYYIVTFDSSIVHHEMSTIFLQVEKAKRFRLAIRQKIASVLSTSCACNFSLHLIDDGVFSCRTFHNFVVYRSKISGLFASRMIQYLSEWVEMNPTLQVDWLLLNIHSSCSVRIDSIDDPDCSIPVPSNTTNIYCI